MTQQEREKRFDEKFPDEEYRELLGSYADHAPIYTHHDGEYTCCPMQYWHIDDIFPKFKQHMEQEIDIAVKAREDEIVEIVNNLTPFSIGVGQDPLVSKDAIINTIKNRV